MTSSHTPQVDLAVLQRAAPAVIHCPKIRSLNPALREDNDCGIVVLLAAREVD